MPCPVRGIVVFKRVYRHYIIRTRNATSLAFTYRLFNAMLPRTLL